MHGLLCTMQVVMHSLLCTMQVVMHGLLCTMQVVMHGLLCTMQVVMQGVTHACMHNKSSPPSRCFTLRPCEAGQTDPRWVPLSRTRARSAVGPGFGEGVADR